MFKSVLNHDPNSNSSMQVKSIGLIEVIFKTENIENFVISNYHFDGVRGDYLGKDNYTLNFDFNYLNYKFEFYLSYDQLEFYISRGGKTLKKFNLEDTVPEDEMLKIFNDALIKYMIQFNLV